MVSIVMRGELEHVAYPISGIYLAFIWMRFCIIFINYITFAVMPLKYLNRQLTTLLLLLVSLLSLTSTVLFIVSDSRISFPPIAQNILIKSKYL